MTSPRTFTVASYTNEGEFQDSSITEIASLDESLIGHFSDQFQLLSGDLELPFEDQLPGEIEFIDYRIGSDLNGAYLLYYFHDEVVFASLLLSGSNEEQETELMQVFKFLLLDSGDEEEPTEEEIDSVLCREEFDFQSIEDRPAIFQIQLSDLPEVSEACKHIRNSDQHLAAAFFAIDRTDIGME